MVVKEIKNNNITFKNPYLLKTIEKIANAKHTTEDEALNEIIQKGIDQIEDELYPDEIPTSYVAEEFGQTTEELVKELDEIGDNGEFIDLDVNKLAKKHGIKLKVQNKN